MCILQLTLVIEKVLECFVQTQRQGGSPIDTNGEGSPPKRGGGPDPCTSPPRSALDTYNMNLKTNGVGGSSGGSVIQRFTHLYVYLINVYVLQTRNHNKLSIFCDLSKIFHVSSHKILPPKVWISNYLTVKILIQRLPN